MRRMVVGGLYEVWQQRGEVVVTVVVVDMVVEVVEEELMV